MYSCSFHSKWLVSPPWFPVQVMSEIRMCFEVSTNMFTCCFELFVLTFDLITLGQRTRLAWNDCLKFTATFHRWSTFQKMIQVQRRVYSVWWAGLGVNLKCESVNTDMDMLAISLLLCIFCMVSFFLSHHIFSFLYDIVWFLKNVLVFPVSQKL